MARKPRRCMTRLEIIQLASRKFLEEGYDATTVSAMAKELDISPGNLTFHFPTKEHLLAELVDLMCRFQWKWMEEAADEGIGSLMAICLELSAMAGISAEDRIIREFFLSAYTSPMCLRIIRANDTERAKKVYAEYCSGWTEEQFAEAEILCSGIEYGTLMLAGEPVSLHSSFRDIWIRASRRRAAWRSGLWDCVQVLRRRKRWASGSPASPGASCRRHRQGSWAGRYSPWMRLPCHS